MLILLHGASLFYCLCFIHLITLAPRMRQNKQNSHSLTEHSCFMHFLQNSSKNAITHKTHPSQTELYPTTTNASIHIHKLTQKMQHVQPLCVNFTSATRFSLHSLHSSLCISRCFLRHSVHRHSAAFLLLFLILQ